MFISCDIIYFKFGLGKAVSRYGLIVFQLIGCSYGHLQAVSVFSQLLLNDMSTHSDSDCWQKNVRVLHFK